MAEERKQPGSVPASRQYVAPARFAASHVLLAVERGTAHSDDQLRSPRVETLSREDRNLTTELVMGTLRWQRVLDEEIAARLRDPGVEMHFGVIIALRLGAYQLIFLDRVPAYAAVTESVELARQADGDVAAGFVNAVLRRMTREGIAQAPGVRDAVRAHPEWMVQRWLSRFGDMGTAQLCAWDQKPAPTNLRLVHADAEASLVAHGVELTPGSFLSAARGASNEQLAGLPANVSSSLRMQDEASQLVGELAALPWENSAAPRRILDACAAPGGKTMILSERHPDAELEAMDVSAPRLRITQRRCAWNPNVKFIAADAAALPPRPTYDLALVDAPCSGTGTLARNPEIRHRLDLEEFPRQAIRQRAILDSVLRAMRPGGRVVYSTCSLEPEENEAVVEAMLAKHPEAEVVPVAGELARLFAAGIITETGYRNLRDTAISGRYLRTLPGLHPCDGFFAAILRVR